MAGPVKTRLLVTVVRDACQYMDGQIFILFCVSEFWYLSTKATYKTSIIMMTSSNGYIFRVCEGNPPISGDLRSHRPATHGFRVFFDLPLNKRLSKHSWCWWFETPASSLWRYCNDNDVNMAKSIRVAKFLLWIRQYVSTANLPDALMHLSYWHLKHLS